MNNRGTVTCRFRRNFASILLTSGLAFGLFALAGTPRPENERQPANDDGAGGLRQVDVFRAGEDGVRVYRIPALLSSCKGTVLAFAEARRIRGTDPPDNIDIVLKRSFDGGATWGPIQVLVDAGEGAASNPTVFEDRDSGAIWMVYAIWPEGVGERNAEKGLTGRTAQVWTIQSKDDGATWSRPVDITPSAKKEEWGAVFPGSGIGIQTRKGRFVVPMARVVFPLSTGGTHSYAICSDDHGKTWRLGGEAGPDTNESQVVELADGSLMLNMRSYRGKYVRALATSGDGGESWGPVTDAPALIEPVCQASILRYSFPSDGRRSRLLFSNPADTKRRVRMTVRLSYDEGESWPISKVVENGPSAYSCLTKLADGTIGLLYETGAGTPYEEIRFGYFSLKWLTDGKAEFGSDPR